MLSNKTLMVLPGDGVGPEVVKETLRVVDWLAENKSINFRWKWLYWKKFFEYFINK